MKHFKTSSSWSFSLLFLFIAAPVYAQDSGAMQVTTSDGGRSAWIPIEQVSIGSKPRLNNESLTTFPQGNPQGPIVQGQNWNGRQQNSPVLSVPEKPSLVSSPGTPMNSSEHPSASPTTTSPAVGKTAHGDLRVTKDL
jgi:hypothetical protein